MTLEHDQDDTYQRAECMQFCTEWEESKSCVNAMKRKTEDYVGVRSELICCFGRLDSISHSFKKRFSSLNKNPIDVAQPNYLIHLKMIPKRNIYLSRIPSILVSRH